MRYRLETKHDDHPQNYGGEGEVTVHYDQLTFEQFVTLKERIEAATFSLWAELRDAHVKAKAQAEHQAGLERAADKLVNAFEAVTGG